MEESETRKKIKSFLLNTNVSIEDDLYTLRKYSKDLWPRNLILDREQESLNPPNIDAVLWPSDVEALQKIVQIANDQSWELYPYGAGSGVCGGATAGKRIQDRLRLVIDLKKMDRIENIDLISQVANVQAGILGQVLEEDLNAKGYTLGHFPSSIYCSSFGGYLATRAAGQLSTMYGKIEDMVLSIEGVLANGKKFETPLAPRMSVGPDWNQLFLGSEGTLAFLTSARVKIHKLAECRKFRAYRVTSTEKALEGIRIWLQMGLRPAVVRVYDEDESRLLMGIKNGVKLIVVVEGEHQVAEFTAQKIMDLSSYWTDWEDLGEEPAFHWWSHRYDVSYRQQQIMSHRRMILDTFEVATVWSQLPALHKAVKDVAKKFSEKALLIILAHFSHFYHTGGNIYFTLCGRSPEEMPTVEFYDEVWDLLLQACEKQGAAISHHHGIGRLKAKSFERQRGEFFNLLKSVKNELDPKHILNPTNLGL